MDKRTGSYTRAEVGIAVIIQYLVLELLHLRRDNSALLLLGNHDLEPVEV